MKHAGKKWGHICCTSWFESTNPDFTDGNTQPWWGVSHRKEHQVCGPSFLEVREARDRITDVSGCAGIPKMSFSLSPPSAVRINMNDAPVRLLMSPVSQRTKRPVMIWWIRKLHSLLKISVCLWCVFRAADGIGLILWKRPLAGSQRCLWHSHQLLRHGWILIRPVSETTNLKSP